MARKIVKEVEREQVGERKTERRGGYKILMLMHKHIRIFEGMNIDDNVKNNHLLYAHSISNLHSHLLAR